MLKKALIAGTLLAASLSAAAEAATFHTSKTFAPKPGGTLKVEAAFQDVRVTIAPGASVEVTVDMKATTWPQDSKESLKPYEPIFSEEGNTLLIRSRPTGTFTIGFSNCSGLIAVKMPPGMHVNLSTGSGDLEVSGDLGASDLTCDTGSGDVKVDGALRNASAETGSGDVKLTLTAPATAVKAHTGSGNVTLSGGAGRVEGSTGSGDISAEGLSGAGAFETGSGNIKCSWSKLPVGVRVSAETGSGDVTLKVPAGAVLAGELHSSSGDVKSEFPGTSSDHGRRFALAGGAGAGELGVDTGSGNITVAKGI
jgi:DUF4097 and DUF4098 domain-containing protein YvlB